MTDEQIDLEENLLTLIHAYLNVHKRATARAIATGIGYSIGRVNEVLKKSEIVICRCKSNRNTWTCNWSDLEPEFRPKGHHRRTKKLPSNVEPLPVPTKPVPNQTAVSPVVHAMFGMIRAFMTENKIAKLTLTTCDGGINIVVG